MMITRAYSGPRAFTNRRIGSRMPAELDRFQRAFVLRHRVCWHPAGHAVAYPAVGMVPEGDSPRRGWLVVRLASAENAEP